MYLSIFYLLSFSLLISFYFIRSFKKVLSHPESLLENFLYENCVLLNMDSHTAPLDFEVKISKTCTHINIFGLKDEHNFPESLDYIYNQIKRNTRGSEVNIYIINSNKEKIFSKKYIKNKIIRPL